jgi:hypothetical protein
MARPAIGKPTVIAVPCHWLEAHSLAFATTNAEALAPRNWYNRAVWPIDMWMLRVAEFTHDEHPYNHGDPAAAKSNTPATGACQSVTIRETGNELVQRAFLGLALAPN